MLSWQIGAVTVKRLVEIEMVIRYEPQSIFIEEARPEALKAVSWLAPHYVTEDGLMILSIHALLVEAPGLKLVVDTCIGNDKLRQSMPDFGLKTAFLEDLAAAGFSREDVDIVICTHLHFDHVGWNTMLENGRWVPTFPRARYLFARSEYEHWLSEREDAKQVEVMAESVRPVFEAGLVTLVEPDHRISNEISLVPTPGHTPGHVSVVIESEGKTAVITGDMIHHPCQIAHPDWSTRADSDKARAGKTRLEMLERWSDGPTLIIGTHFAAPTAGHIRRVGTAWRFE